MEGGGLRAVLVWHRRAGKDSFSLNWTAVCALSRRKGVYWHMLPTAKQGRKVIWDAIDRYGRRMIDQAFPMEIRKSTNQQEMRIEFYNGSIWQVVGSDNYDSLVGANPVGVVFSEYSVADPAAWRFLSPILAENGGWAIFIYTPRGKNHGYKLYKLAKKNVKWFDEILPLTKSQAYDVSIVDEEIEMGMTPEHADQEYGCSFNAEVAGAYYGKAMTASWESGRISKVPWEPDVKVHTAWDLGMNDELVIWFYQIIGKEIRIIDMYHNRGQGLEYYVKELDKRPYVYGTDFLPHDAKVKELGTGKSRLETLRTLGRRCRVVPKLGLQDGINAVRKVLPRCWIDEEKCQTGIEAMEQYHSKFDEKNDTHQNTPVHDWASHYADGFRYLAISIQENFGLGKLQGPLVEMDYDIHDHNARTLVKQARGNIQHYDPFSSTGFDPFNQLDYDVDTESYGHRH